MFFKKEIDTDKYCLKSELQESINQNKNLKKEKENLQKLIFLLLDILQNMKKDDESLKNDLEIKNIKKVAEIIKTTNFDKDSDSLELIVDIIKDMKKYLNSSKEIEKILNDVFKKYLK